VAMPPALDHAVDANRHRRRRSGLPSSRGMRDMTRWCLTWTCVLKSRCTNSPRACRTSRTSCAFSGPACPGRGATSCGATQPAGISSATRIAPARGPSVAVCSASA
jgi:hypothetical protein